jgi:hypothetical protein
MRFKIFFFLAFFATSAVSAQLYDNRNRYLLSPHHYDRFEQELDGPPKKPAKRYIPRKTSSRNSYNYYRNRVNQYSKSYLTHIEFYESFRNPDIHGRYTSSKKILGGSESGINLKDCHCNYGSDIKAFDSWYRAQQMGRRALLNFYEGLFEKKLEKLLNKNFPNFKEAQKAFYKEYGKIKDNKYRQQVSNMISNDLYRSQLEFGKAKSYYRFFDYVKKQNDINIRQTSSRTVKTQNDNNIRKTSSRTNDLVGGLVVDGQLIRLPSRRRGAPRRLMYRTSNLNTLYNNMKDNYKSLLISKKISDGLNHSFSLFYDYLSEKYIDHYNDESNYEYRLGAFNGYIEHYQNQVGYGVRLPTHNYGNYMLFEVPYNENELRTFFKKRLAKNIDYTYRGSLPTIETAIANVAMFELDEFNSRELSLIRLNRLKDKEHKKRLYGKIKQAVLNKKTLKNAVIQYFKNAIPIDYNAIQAVKDAVGSRLENKPFKWSELENMPYLQYQNVTNPSTIFLLDLTVRREGRSRRAPSYYEYKKYKGIANVLKYLYDNPKYRSVEGATLRHFLKQKGLNVPSSLSNRDLGTLFDFGGGNSNTLTIQFSDYAKKYITNFQHYDGKYGTSLFTDLVKLKKLYDILKERPVDFSNNKKPCVGDPVPNPEIAPQKNSGIQGGMHDTCARKNRKAICKGVKGRKLHNGVDLKNPYGAPIYAIYDGVATKHTQYKNGKITGAGYYSVIESKINGQNVRMVYFHLQEDNRITGAVKAGDIIGYQGDSGNLKNGILQGHAISHVHIKTQVNGIDDNPLNHMKTKINPNTGKLISRCN